jgi:hypothetical protein
VVCAGYAVVASSAWASYIALSKPGSSSTHRLGTVTRFFSTTGGGCRLDGRLVRGGLIRHDRVAPAASASAMPSWALPTTSSTGPRLFDRSP